MCIYTERLPSEIVLVLSTALPLSVFPSDYFPSIPPNSQLWLPSSPPSHQDFVPHRPNQHFTLHMALDGPRAEPHPGPDGRGRETGARPPILDPVPGPRGAVGVEL
jgi:hypothetical protein